MYKPKHTPLSAHKKDLTPSQETGSLFSQSPLPTSFTLLVWNVQKTHFSHWVWHPITQIIKELTAITPPDLLAIQEAFTPFMHTHLFNFPFVMAPNIQTKNGHYGVLTASPHPMKGIQQCLTRTRELGLTTHKTALITHHPLPSGQILTLVNIHAINFVGNQTFKKELNLLWRHLTHQTGPMIVCGDFNTWNKVRLLWLKKATQSLNLEAVVFPDTRPIKTLMRQPLDHIFYRNLNVQTAQALAVPSISDHNPLIATFSDLKTGLFNSNNGKI